MATYKHIRSATANKRPTTSIADGQLAINTNTASPGLFFKDSAGTGIVKVGPVHVGTTAPNSTPASGGSSGNYLGEQWLDTSVSPAQMKVWNGSAWVGVVADELPVSKLQDGAAGQIVQTDSAGTGVEWSSTANLPVGSASVPAYRFQGDANTGLYSPGADQVAISTGGTGRLFIDSSGRLGLGISNPSRPLTVNGVIQSESSALSGGLFYGAYTGTTAGNQLGVLDFYGNGTGVTGEVKIAGILDAGSTTSAYLSFNTTLSGTLTEKVRITSDGKAGIGSTAPLTTLECRGQFSISNNATSYWVLDRDDSDGRLKLLDSSTSTNERLAVDSSGRLLVGTSSARSNFYNSTVSALFQQEGAASAGDPASRFVSQVYGRSNNDGPIHILAKHRSTSVGGTTVVASGDQLGILSFQGSDGTQFVEGAQIAAYVDSTPGADDMPGRLVFSTTADSASSPTERMRIKNDGTINFSNVSVYADNAAAISGGLAVGDVYRTSTGQLMIRY